MNLLAANEPFITNDAIIITILFSILAFVLKTSEGKSPFFKKLYTFLPPVLLCYFVPGILNSANVISGQDSALYPIASRYLLPASLVLLIMGVDLKELWKMRRKAGLMFLAGSTGIIIGGPLAILIVSTFAPGIVGGTGDEATWRGLATIAGSWTGGSANMAALYEVFKPSPSLYSGMIALDVIVANCWLALLLFGVGRSKKLDKFFKSDPGDMEEIKKNIENYKMNPHRVPSMPDLMAILAVGLGVTGIAHGLVSIIVPWIKINMPQLERFSLTSEFFWLIIFATTAGLILSLTKVRRLESAGASRIGSLFLFILIGTIGMQMDILAFFTNPGLIIVGFIWIAIHAILMIVMGRILKIPYFFFAVSSEANIGGAPTASIVAAAFHPALIPVGVLLSVFGYAVGNYAGYICGLLMQLVAP